MNRYYSSTKVIPSIQMTHTHTHTILRTHAHTHHRHQCIDEILTRERRGVRRHEQEDGVRAEDEDGDDGLTRKTVAELRVIAKEKNVTIKTGSRKQDIIDMIRTTMSVVTPTTEEVKRSKLAHENVDQAAHQVFNADIVTPYCHVLGAHVWEQMITLDAFGRFIGHQITHKHCSCSPCELANNRYNRIYFARSSRRRGDLEEEILLVSWRCTMNLQDIERHSCSCPHCGKTFVREACSHFTFKESILHPTLFEKIPIKTRH
jgi:hypothetical protein